MEFLVVNPRVRIPMSEFEWTFARSSGPGGQNVNKVNSKAILRWPIRQSAALPAEIQARFATTYRTRITADGDVVIHSQRYRDQARNIADCLEKLRAMIEGVACAPKKRRSTKATRGSVERRLQTKQKHSETKQRRAETGWDGH